MSDSVYRVTQVIGTSPDSWEAAAHNAVETASDEPFSSVLSAPIGSISCAGFWYVRRTTTRRCSPRWWQALPRALWH